jgi:hypothetical protein
MKKTITFFRLLPIMLMALLLTGSGMKAWGQIAAWDFTGVGTSSISTLAATTFNSNLVSTSGANNISRGSSAAWSTGGNSFRTTGFSNNGIATSNTDYYQITLTPATGYNVSLSTIDAKFAGTSTYCVSPGVLNQFAYSLDGSNFTLIGSAQALIGSPATLTQIDLSGITALQNVAAGTTITLRYYASGRTTTGGWGFNSPSSGSNGLAIGGTVSSAGGSAPTVTTQAPSSIGTTTATGNGNITATGGVNATARGFCWDLATNADPDIADTKVEETGDFSTGAFTGSISGLTAGTQYKVRAYATNSVGTSYGSVQTFTTLSTEPTAHASSFTSTAISQTQIDLSFDAASTITNATGYLILQKTGSAPTGAPVDATAYTVGNTIGDGTVAAIITNTADVSKSITGLTAGTHYYFTLFPYSGSGSSINYKTDGSVPGANSTTLAALATTSEVSGPALGSQPNPTSISSLATTDVAAVRVFDMDIYDYGVDSDPTKITQLTIKAGTNNTANWANTIQGIKLSTDAGATFVTVGTPTISASSIVIPITSGNLNIPNSDALTVSLYIYLKTSGLTDNQILEFKVDATAASHGFIADATGSTFTSTFTSAPVSNQILVNVVASKIAFVQQPTNVGTSTNISPAVTVSANDANGNRDLDYVSNVSISATGLTGSPVVVTPVAGLATFSALSFPAEATGVTLSASSGSFTDAISSTFNIILVPIAGEIVINQFNPGYNTASNEYIELVNRSNKTFDLSQLKIMYSSASGSGPSSLGTLSGSLQPYSYWLLSPDATVTAGLTSALTRDGSFTAGMAAASGQIALETLGNTKIDGVAYGTITVNTLGEGSAAPTPATAKDGIKRTSEGIDNNANSTDFVSTPLAGIYLRNHNSLCIASNYTLPATSYPADIVISGSSPAVALSGNTSISGKLSIQSGSLNVASNQNLTVTGTLTNNGTLNLLSDATGTATLLTPATLSGSGTYNVKQYLPAGRNSYISSPVSAATTAALSSASSVVSYNEQTAAWDTESGTLTPLKGYISANNTTSGAITFSGTINNGDLSISPTRHTGVTKEGFNLVGNPYPSYVNWASATKTNLLTTMWYRTRSASAYVFDTYNSTGNIGTALGTTTVSSLIPPMQGFWVRVDAGQTSGTLGFTNAMRSHADVSTNSFKAPEVTAQQVLRLQVSNGENKDEAIVLFNDAASNGYDAYDSPKMTNANVAIPEIYTMAGTEQLVINGLNSITANQELPLGFKTGQSNLFTIKATEISNFEPGMKVILRDNVLATEQELNDGSTYSFSSDVATTTTRFTVLFKSAGVTTGLNAAENQVAYIYKNANNQISVRLKGDLSNEATVSIFNAVGQKLYTKQITSSNTTLNTFASGIYLVTVNNGGKSVTSKVILN